MDARREREATPTKNRTDVERKSERELVVRRTVNAPARLVFEAWTKAELFRRWWRRRRRRGCRRTGRRNERQRQREQKRPASRPHPVPLP